jgi:hypothetical protein
MIRMKNPAGLQSTVLSLPQGKFLGKRLGDPPTSEADHFIRCPACGGWIDCRDLAQVSEHEGPLPHPAQDGDGFAWRQDCLTCRTHWSCSVPKSYFLFFYVFIFYVFIFLEKQFAIGGMAYFDE